MEVANDIPVSVIVTGRNSADTLESCLVSLAGQEYLVGEIFFFDNGSSDNSVEIARSVASRVGVPINIVDGGKCGSISRAYNRGAGMAKCDIIVLCHSDCMINSPGELRKLVAPLLEDKSVVVAYPTQTMPLEVWRRYTFWQKFLFVTAVERREGTKCATFDAYWRTAFIEGGGFNERRFTTTCGYGGEDSDAAVRFSKMGRCAMTEALAVHLHSFSAHYGFKSYLGTRAMLSRTYGKMLRWQNGVAQRSDLLLFVRPVLALLPFTACLGFLLFPPWGAAACVIASFLFQVAFCFMASRNMFVHRETLRDPRILLVLPVTWFMIYYETIWLLQGLLTPCADEIDEVTKP